METTCPCCGQRFAVEDESFLADASRAYFHYLATKEVECPGCEWVFAIDSEGEVIDDGELERGDLFAVDDDGEWIAEEMVRVTCPHCHNTHETDGPGVTTCPHCKHTLDVDDRGRALNEKVVPIPECPQCGMGLEEEEWGGMSCPYCGRTFLSDREPEE